MLINIFIYIGNQMSRAKTILCDIDGTLIKQYNKGISQQGTDSPPILDGTINKINEWEGKGYCIVLTTARPESLRVFTCLQLRKRGIFFHQLVMGVTPGIRVLINDRSNNGEDKARAINVDRNKGIANVEI